MSCYIHSDGTFELKSEAVIVRGGGKFVQCRWKGRSNDILWNNEKKFFPTYSVFEKSTYH